MTQSANPCPLCGASARILFDARADRDFVVCSNPDCRIELPGRLNVKGSVTETEDELIARWNALPRDLATKETLRDRFAMAAMSAVSHLMEDEYFMGMVARHKKGTEFAVVAYMLADAMMEARKPGGAAT